MQGIIFLVIVAAVAGLTWLDQRDGVFFNMFTSSTSTPSFFDSLKDDEDGEGEESRDEERSGGRTSEPAPETVSSADIEKKVDETLKDLDALEEDLRALELRQPVSPFAGMVTIKASGAKATSPEKEYVTITANANNTGPVTISGWRLESYFTSSRATIPKGARLLRTHTSRTEDTITLLPGEQAHLVTGETPVNTSFRENTCSGYLAEYGDFTPSIKKSCPLPQDELLTFSSVKVSDSKCAEYIDTISRCEIPDEDEVNDENLSGSCESFISGILDYEGCVTKHDEDADFFTGGSWYIYLDKERELWRSTREIVRLLDSSGKVVDVAEY